MTILVLGENERVQPSSLRFEYSLSSSIASTTLNFLRISVLFSNELRNQEKITQTTATILRSGYSNKDEETSAQFISLDLAASAEVAQSYVFENAVNTETLTNQEGNNEYSGR